MTRVIAHVATHIDFLERLPFRLSKSVVLRKATAEEIAQFELRNQTVTSALSVLTRSYRHNYSDSGWVNLSELDWRYWVVDVDHPDEGELFHIIEKVLILFTPSIFLSFAYLEFSDGVTNGTRPIPVHSLLRVENQWWKGIKGEKVSATELAALCESVVNSVALFKEEFSFIKESMDRFFDIQQLPPDAEMYVLGLFSVIESLITHKPRPEETINSINHQIVNKLYLLDAEMINSPAAHEKYFPELPHDKLWKKLYAYRSQLTHTSKRYLSGDLKVLISHSVVIEFLEVKIKELLIFSISRPGFMKCLKAC